MHTVVDLHLPDGHRTALVGALAGPDSPVAVLLPALGTPAGYYEPFLHALAERGVTAFSADFPGQGGSRPLASARNNFGYAVLAEVFVPHLLDVVAQRHPGRPVTIVGHSLGGQVGLLTVALTGREAASVVLIGAGAPYWRAYPNRLTTLAKTQFVSLVAAARGHWPGHRLGFGGRQPRLLMQEWSHFARTGRLDPVGTSRPAAAALAELTTRVLAVDLANDTLAPRASVDQLVSLLPAARVEQRHFERPKRPGRRPLDHFSWAREPEGIDDLVAAWVHSH